MEKKIKIMKIIKNKSRGITLIALVITIIVLLILVGITISALTGDNRNIWKSARSSIQNKNGRI